MGYGGSGPAGGEKKMAPADAARIKEAQEQQRLRKAAAAGLSGQQSNPKRRRLDQLQPEDEFMSANREPQAFQVKVPSGGVMKTLDFNIPVTTTVGQLKQDVQRTLGISMGNVAITNNSLGPLEDGRTLAYYNLAAGADLTLSVSKS